MDSARNTQAPNPIFNAPNPNHHAMQHAAQQYKTDNMATTRAAPLTTANIRLRVDEEWW